MLREQLVYIKLSHGARSPHTLVSEIDGPVIGPVRVRMHQGALTIYPGDHSDLDDGEGFPLQTHAFDGGAERVVFHRMVYRRMQFVERASLPPHVAIVSFATYVETYDDNQEFIDRFDTEPDLDVPEDDDGEATEREFNALIENIPPEDTAHPGYDIFDGVRRPAVVQPLTLPDGWTADFVRTEQQRLRAELLQQATLRMAAVEDGMIMAHMRRDADERTREAMDNAQVTLRIIPGVVSQIPSSVAPPVAPVVEAPIVSRSTPEMNSTMTNHGFL